MKIDYAAISQTRKSEMTEQKTNNTISAETTPEPKDQKIEPADSPPKKPTKGARRGLPDGWTRFTVTVPIELAERMKDLAYTERKKIKTVVVDAFEAALEGKKLKHRPDDEG